MVEETSWLTCRPLGDLSPQLIDNTVKWIPPQKDSLRAARASLVFLATGYDSKNLTIGSTLIDSGQIRVPSWPAERNCSLTLSVTGAVRSQKHVKDVGIIEEDIPVGMKFMVTRRSPASLSAHGYGEGLSPRHIRER